jgi:hypothetical protein
VIPSPRIAVIKTWHGTTCGTVGDRGIGGIISGSWGDGTERGLRGGRNGSTVSWGITAPSELSDVIFGRWGRGGFRQSPDARKIRRREKMKMLTSPWNSTSRWGIFRCRDRRHPSRKFRRDLRRLHRRSPLRDRHPRPPRRRRNSCRWQPPSSPHPSIPIPGICRACSSNRRKCRRINPSSRGCRRMRPIGMRRRGPSSSTAAIAVGRRRRRRTTLYRRGIDDAAVPWSNDSPWIKWMVRHDGVHCLHRVSVFVGAEYHHRCSLGINLERGIFRGSMFDLVNNFSLVWRLLSLLAFEQRQGKMDQQYLIPMYSRDLIQKTPIFPTRPPPAPF